MQRVCSQIEVPKESVEENSINVAVLDTGISRHPDLSGKLLAFRDFVGSRKYMYDDNGHGTHVCGIICGSGKLSGMRLRGISPSSKLVVGKVLDANGDGNVENMLEALEWIENIYEEYHIRILNISVGIGNMSDVEKERLLQERIEKLWDKGILVVCAAGNKGPADGSISSVCGSGKVITVGCHDGEYCRDNAKRCENYSGRGDAFFHRRKPDLVAPGTDILSCNAAYRPGNGKFPPYVAKSGTSMATPIVTGAAALAFQKFPKMSNEELKQKITITATDLQEPWNKQGWGMVNVRRLLE